MLILFYLALLSPHFEKRKRDTLLAAYFHLFFLVPEEDYRNVPKFSDRQVWANSADPDQTAPRGAV